MASDLSNIFKEEIANTLESLLAKSTTVGDVKLLEDVPYSSEQCVKVDVKMEFSNISSVLSFYIPTHAATKFEYFMLGGMGDLKEHIDDEIADAVNEIVSNICGSVVTSSNAQGFTDLGSSKFEVQGSEIVECSTLDGKANCFNFNLDMDGEAITLAIAFDESILPYISSLRGVEAAPESASAAPTASGGIASETVAPAPAHGGESSALSALLGENAVDNLKLLFDIRLRLSVRLGTKVFLLKDILRWDIGEIIELDQMVNEPLDILINGVKIGEGEAVIVEGKFGIKVRTIGSDEDKINQISLGK